MTPPTRRMHPDALGWCAPNFFTLRWPYAVFAAGQVFRDAGGFLTGCSYDVLWIADLAARPVIRWRDVGGRP